MCWTTYFFLIQHSGRTLLNVSLVNIITIKFRPCQNHALPLVFIIQTTASCLSFNLNTGILVMTTNPRNRLQTITEWGTVGAEFVSINLCQFNIVLLSDVFYQLQCEITQCIFWPPRKLLSPSTLSSLRRF